MIGVKKNRNNYQKLPSVKQSNDTINVKSYTGHCAPIASYSNIITPTKAVKTSVTNTISLGKSTFSFSGDNVKRIYGKRVDIAKYSKSKTTASNRFYPINNHVSKFSNPVRQANQNFFLSPADKDKHFLKDEYELAHSLVSKPKLSTITACRPRITSNKTHTWSSTEHYINQNINNSYGSKKFYNNNSLKRGSIASTVSSTLAVPAATTVHGMRLSGNSNHGCLVDGSDTKYSKNSNTLVDQYKNLLVDVVFSSALPKKLIPIHTTTVTKPKYSLTSTYKAGTNNHIKPLVHRNLNLNNNIYNNNNIEKDIYGINNCKSKHDFNNNNKVNCNKNMQTNIERDEEIKFIDSDEHMSMSVVNEQRKLQTSTAYDRNNKNYFHDVTSTETSSKNHVRPKSTIVCSTTMTASLAATTLSSSLTPSANNLPFENLKNCKYINEYDSSNISPSASPVRSLNRRLQPRSELYCSELQNRQKVAIDSNSVGASIEKFNNFSEKKRLPLNTVTIRSNNVTETTTNLQNRFSNDFENLNVRLPYSSCAVSVLRNGNYHSGLGINSQPITKTISHCNYQNSAPVLTTATVTSSIRSIKNNVQNNTGSLPLKSSRNCFYTDELAVSVAKPSVTQTISKNKTFSASRLQCDTNVAVNNMHSSVSSPPVSRYWDYNNSRTSALVTSAGSHHIHHSDDTKKSTDDVNTAGLCGLRNIGNTCFMNSVIQCLSHTSELTHFLRSYNVNKTAKSKDEHILNEFSKLIKEMWMSNVSSVTPMDLKRAFSAKHRMYSDYNQQDAQEFLRFFLDSLHSALNKGVKGEQLKIDDNLSDNKKAELTWEWYCRHENSVIRDLFVGQLKSTLRCTVCGNTSVTFDPFWDLSVPLPSSSRCKLDVCLDLFIREEVLDGDEMPKCSRCQTRRKCTKSFTIQRFPKYLVIHLKRFSETRWSKLSSLVEFPTNERELNMGPYGANNHTNIYYSLYAISNHMGSTAGGHYVALCKHPVSHKWHEFNDNFVSSNSIDEQLVSPSAYILFYERA